MDESLTWPAVSVVMPARDAAGSVAAAMRAALAQEYPGDLELVVAVAAGSDGTRSAALEVADVDPRVIVVENPEGTASAGLNLAIRRCRGDVVVRCDAQALLPAGYVLRAVRTLDETGADVVGGMQAASGTTPLERAIAIGMTTPVGTGGPRFRVGGEPGPTDTVYLGVFRRSTLRTVGLFDEAMVRNQDYELNHRIRSEGGTVYFDPELTVAYRPRHTLRGLWRQYFDYGTWKRRMLRRHPESIRARQLAAPLLVIGLVASIVLAFTPWRALALVIPGAYALALLATAAVELIRRRDPAALLAPATVATMHLAWGIGFLGSDGSAPTPRIPGLEG